MGKTKVKTEGVEGVQRVTSKVQYINGQEQRANTKQRSIIEQIKSLFRND